MSEPRNLEQNGKKGYHIGLPAFLALVPEVTVRPLYNKCISLVKNHVPKNVSFGARSLCLLWVIGIEQEMPSVKSRLDVQPFWVIYHWPQDDGIVLEIQLARGDQKGWTDSIFR